MSNVRINNEIGLTYPESFSEMGSAELTKYFGSADNRWGVYDEERHIILSAGWIKPRFLHSFSDSESVLDGIEAHMRRRVLNYQRITAYKMKLGNKKLNANGVRFEYRVNDAAIVQAGDVVVFKHKKLFYIIHFITRKVNASAVLPEFKEILESVTF